MAVPDLITSAIVYPIYHHQLFNLSGGGGVKQSQYMLKSADLFIVSTQKVVV